MLGLGVSLGFPLAVSAASGLRGRSSAGNVAILTQLTLCGFLIGPPMIGLIAELGNMRLGLAALCPALLLALVSARALKPQAATSSDGL
jgi:MFS family permease